MKSNYHTHSYYCDGAGSPREYVEEAISRNFTALGFSGHTPLPFANEWTMSDRDFPRYIEEIGQLKSEYADTLDIFLGLETDYLDEKRNPAEAKYTRLSLDYQIGSVHHLYSPQERRFIPVDASPEEIDRLLEKTYNGDINALVRDYYSMIREMIKIGGFDILGHLDLIKKHNGDNRYFDEGERWYIEAVEETLETVAESGVIMEVNTGAMARGYTDEPYPSPWILSRTQKLGIPVMLNADAHKPEWIDYAFPEVDRMIRDAGYSARHVLTKKGWKEISYE